MQPISFTDAYGLGLIAKNPKLQNRDEIIKYLSFEAKQIADAIIKGSGSREAKSAARELRGLARKMRTSSQP